MSDNSHTTSTSHTTSISAHHEELPIQPIHAQNKDDQSKLPSYAFTNMNEKERTQQLMESALISIIQRYQGEQQSTVPTSNANLTAPLPVALPSITTINSPVIIQDLMCASGEKKIKESLDQTIILSLLSGLFVGLGCIASLKTGGNMPGWDETNPGFPKFIFSAVFTVGLILVIVTGSELFTGNAMAMFVGLLRKKVTAWQAVKNLVLSVAFNILGAFMTIYFLLYLPTPAKDITNGAGYVVYAKSVGLSKVAHSQGVTILLAIGCNILVCLAVYVTYASNVLADKIIALFMPILAFVASGYEHCVANGAFIPLAMLYGADITMYDFFVNNLMPAILGNLLGGAFFVGMCFWYTHGFRSEHLSYFDEHITLKFRAAVAAPILKLWDKVQAINPFLKKEEEIVATNIELPEQNV